ncbi:hypothetical protein NL676_039021 [Syzygium grande]|nr:hypothetical protein NL676_039021 [Syzygium grande]
MLNPIHTLSLFLYRLRLRLPLRLSREPRRSLRAQICAQEGEPRVAASSDLHLARRLPQEPLRLGCWIPSPSASAELRSALKRESPRRSELRSEEERTQLGKLRFPPPPPPTPNGGWSDQFLILAAEPLLGASSLAEPGREAVRSEESTAIVRFFGLSCRGLKSRDFVPILKPVAAPSSAGSGGGASPLRGWVVGAAIERMASGRC